MKLLIQVPANWHAGHAIGHADGPALLKVEILKLHNAVSKSA